MPKFEAYRTGDPPRIWCGQCGKPFPLEIVTFQYAFGQMDEGDNIVWEGKWLYDAKDGLSSPHDDLLENLQHGRPAGADTRLLLPIPGRPDLQYRGAWVLRVPGCPRAAVCPYCLVRNEFNAVRLRVSPKEPKHRGV